MVMTCCHHTSSTAALLFVLFIITPQLADTTPVLVEDPQGNGDGNEPLELSREEQTTSEQNHLTGMDSARALASVLLEALDHPARKMMGVQGESADYRAGKEGHQQETWGSQENKGNLMQERVGEEKMEGPESGSVATAEGDEERGALEQAIDAMEGKDERSPDKNAESQTKQSVLNRKTRGYFKNIDLGLQDNEILPPLKGYKAYNQQLAQASKKLKWQEERARNPPQYDRNFMDDFDNEEDEEETLIREEEEARARAEQEEVRRQEAEAQEARDEEQRLADIASDMVLKYMGRKQQAASYMKDRLITGLGNVAEDKRSNEVEDTDDDEIDPQTIDKLIEISSKLHLPADDVVEIISDVEEKRKRKDSLPSNIPRFRPLVPLPRMRAPVYQYPKSPKKTSYKVNPYKKWHKGKGKAKMNQMDYWFKPPKQFLAYPSFPYYQKPYRAYYPVYFPPPKPSFFSKPALSFDYSFGGSMDYGFKPPKRIYRVRAKAKERNWKQLTPRPPTLYPLSDAVISNYILPHPRTYQDLPMPKPRSPSNGRPPPHFYPSDYVYDEADPQQESDEELENFIEKIYFNRRMF